MAKNDSQLGCDFRTFRGHMENHAKNDQKSRFKKWDAKPFLRIIHDVISIFRLHFPQKAGMNGLPQNLAFTPNRPSARCKTILCLSTRPYRRNAEELKSYAGKALFKGEFKKS